MMSKVFVLPPKEDWIVDRLVSEWYQYNSDISTRSLEDCDTVWLLADWCYSHLDARVLRQKKVVTTIHHIVPEKWTSSAEAEFKNRDDLTSVYHVPNVHTKRFIEKLTSKTIHVIPYWANQNIWKRNIEKREIRSNLGIQEDQFVIGSFQRDTEGHDLSSPKLEKGPDILADAIIEWSKDRKIHVLLAGWRRQYLLSRLESSGIKTTYIERPDQHVLNQLYQSIDLYPVTSRYEGGPQSLIECGLLGIPVVSRNIGIASEVLSSQSVNDKILSAVPSIPDVENLKIPRGFAKYRDMFAEI
jgi:hypothetical protein